MEVLFNCDATQNPLYRSTPGFGGHKQIAVRRQSEVNVERRRGLQRAGKEEELSQDYIELRSMEEVQVSRQMVGLKQCKEPNF